MVFRGLDDAHEKLIKSYDNHKLDMARKKILGIDYSDIFFGMESLPIQEGAYLAYNNTSYSGYCLGYPVISNNSVHDEQILRKDYISLVNELDKLREFSLNSIKVRYGKLGICFFDMGEYHCLTGLVNDELVFLFKLGSFVCDYVTLNKLDFNGDRIFVTFTEGIYNTSIIETTVIIDVDTYRIVGLIKGMQLFDFKGE